MAKQDNPQELDISERMVPSHHKGHGIYAEHLVRYEAAKPIVKDKIVLDIASGSGYGTKLISESAAKVFGVDISEESVRYAEKHYGAKNIEYKVGDGESIPLDDNSVDVVVSFETIEHIKDYAKFMAQVHRVLKEDGLLILSTPNELEFAEGNHYHLHEFEENELIDLIKKHYKNIKMYYQGAWVYSGVFNKIFMSEEITAPQSVATMQLSPLKPEQYLYFYALCSNRSIDENIEAIAATGEHWSVRQIQTKDQMTNNHIQNISDMLEGVTKHAKALEKQAKLKDNHIQALEQELNDLKRFLPVRIKNKLRGK